MGELTAQYSTLPRCCSQGQLQVCYVGSNVHRCVNIQVSAADVYWRSIKVSLTPFLFFPPSSSLHFVFGEHASPRIIELNQQFIHVFWLPIKTPERHLSGHKWNSHTPLSWSRTCCHTVCSRWYREMLPSTHEETQCRLGDGYIFWHFTWVACHVCQIRYNCL